MFANELLESLKEAVGPAKKEFEEELEEYAKKIAKTVVKIKIAKLDGDQIKQSKYEKNLLHIRTQLSTKATFAKSKAKKAGYDVVRGTLKLVITTVIGTLV